jgi:hypothetical protein
MEILILLCTSMEGTVESRAEIVQFYTILRPPVFTQMLHIYIYTVPLKHKRDKIPKGINTPAGLSKLLLSRNTTTQNGTNAI